MELVHVPARSFMKTVAPRKFTEAMRSAYLARIAMGAGRFQAAKAVGVHPETVRRFSRSSPEFKQAVIDAEDEASEAVELRLYAAAVDGEPYAVKMWLQARAKARWGVETASGGVTVNVADGGQAVVAVGDGRLAEIKGLRERLEERAGLAADDE